MTKEKIPLYNIEAFNKQSDRRQKYLVEIFDNRKTFRAPFPHRHSDFYEILFLHQGSGTHTIDFVQYEIKPPCIFFLSPGQVHTLDPSDDICGYLFLFTADFLLTEKQDKNGIFDLPFFYNLNNESAPLYIQHQTDVEAITQLCRIAVQEYDKALPDSPDVVRPLLEVLLAFCKRLYPARSQEATQAKGKILVKRFKQAIEEHYLEYRSVKDFADYLHSNPSHLNETVKQFTGRTASELIKDKVMLEIKRKLLYTDLTVSEIAFQFGFVDQSYFSKYFRQREGLSPQAFREQAVKENAKR